MNGSLISDHGAYQIGNGASLDRIYMNGVIVWHRQISFDGMDISTPAAVYSGTAGGVVRVGMRGISSSFQGKTYYNKIQVWTQDSVDSGWAAGVIFVSATGVATGSSIRSGYGLTTSGGKIYAYANGRASTGVTIDSSTGAATGSSFEIDASNVTVYFNTSGGSFRIGANYGGDSVYTTYKRFYDFTHWYNV